jgi:hypothetical protein
MPGPRSLRRPRLFALGVAIAAGSAAWAAGDRAPAVAPATLVTEAQMLDETTALAQAVSRARRTPLKIDWQRRLISAADARAAAEANVRGGASPAETEVDEKLFQRLGLLDRGASYLDRLAGAVGRDPAGFYEPSARRLSVPDFVSLAEQRPALAHEIAHALQDQRFGLRRFLTRRAEAGPPPEPIPSGDFGTDPSPSPPRRSGVLVAGGSGNPSRVPSTMKTTPDGRRGLSLDEQLARQALIEGDASVLSMEALDPRGAFPAPMELADTTERAREGVVPAFPPHTPRFLRELLAFPYIDGFAFVARERATASWAAIDAIWGRPPESTTQILHPEKYDRRQSPVEIELPQLPLMGDGLRLVRADTLGELVLRVWLAAPGPGLAADPLLTRETAERAATGWRGDRVAIYLPAAADAPPPASLPDAGAPPPARAAAALALLTTWESDGDADDFLQSVAPRLAALAAGGELELALPIDASERPAVWRERGGDTVFGVQRRGTAVALLLGAPEAAIPSLGTMLDVLSPKRGDRSRRAKPARR